MYEILHRGYVSIGTACLSSSIQNLANKTIIHGWVSIYIRRLCVQTFWSSTCLVLRFGLDLCKEIMGKTLDMFHVLLQYPPQGGTA